MADVKVPYPEVGLAAFEELDAYAADILYSGSDPKPAPGHPFPVTADLELKQFEVVTLTAGKLAKATASGTKAIGIVSQAVKGNADGTTTVPVLWSGCFNPDALVWDASFDTLAKKENAFFGAPTPTTVLLRERQK